MVIHSRKVEKDTLGGALHFYEVDKKGRFLDCRTLADIYRTEKSLRDEIRRLKYSNKGTRVEDLRQFCLSRTFGVAESTLEAWSTL